MAALHEDFMRLFRGLPRAHGVYQLPPADSGGIKKGSKVEGRAMTVRGQVTAGLWESHLRGAQGLGIVPITDEGVCYFGAIDVDKYDLNLNEVEEKCAYLALPVLPTRTKSGGVHLYCFYAEGAPAPLVRERLTEWSIALGYGGAEIFPKQDKLLSVADVGNWINMPYFGALSPSGTERFGIYKGAPLAAEDYIRRAAQLALSTKQLRELALPAQDSDEDFVQAPPCLQSLARNKGFNQGSRNNGLFAVAVYLRKRFPDEWAEKLAYYNGKYFTPSLNPSEVKMVIRSVSRKTYNYNCHENPCKANCNRMACLKRDFGVGKLDAEFGLVMENAQRIKSEPPYWIVNVGGIPVEVTAADLLHQYRFQERCINALSFLPPTLPSDKWVALVNKMMSEAQDVEAPPEASVRGELAFHLEQYCTVHPQAETREELLVGKPYTELGYTMFRVADFKGYLAIRHVKVGENREFYAELRKLGAEGKQLDVKGKNVSVWTVKAFDPTIPVVPPRLPNDEGQM